MDDLYLATRNIGSITQEGLGNTQFVFSKGFNDLSLGPNKDFAIISNINKLQQDIIKIISTVRGSNSVYPAYGSTIENNIGVKNIEQKKAGIRDSIIEALTVLQIINKDNPDLDEQIQSIDKIKLDFNNNDEMIVSIQITTKNGNVVNTVSTI